MHITYTYEKEGKVKILQMPFPHIHKQRQRNILNIVNKKRLEKHLPELDMKTMMSKKYTQGFLPLT